MKTPLPEHLITPLGTVMGARVLIYADDILRDGMATSLLDALEQFRILVFPGIDIDDQTLVALSESLGDMEAARVTADGSPASARGIYRIALDKTDKSQREYVKGYTTAGPLPDAVL